jgi:hypothetical protein
VPGTLLRAAAPLLLLLTTTSLLAQAVPVPASGNRATPVHVRQNPLLPQAVTSFGACRAGNQVYVFGGHIGREHAHSRANLVGTLHRFDLVGNAGWQTLAEGPALQGTTLVAGPGETVWRVGGMTARNDAGADADLHSTASVACFDPAQGTWTEMTPLPEPRSSHDAIVLDDRLYVVGGWNLHGSDDGEWHQSAWVADLRQRPIVWQPIPGPGVARRAAALATFAGKVVLLGGLGEDGMLDSVQSFDPTAGRWADGPKLPGKAFGTAALGIGDQLYATVMDGRLLAWNGGDTWQPVAQLETPRFFHRMVPALDPTQILMLAGAGAGGHMRTTELVDTQPRQAFTLSELEMPAPGKVSDRQTLLLRDNTLWAFGGSRGLKADRFAAEQFADDVWRIDLLAHTATKVANLPHGVQSMAATTWGGKADNLLVGGLGLDAAQPKAHSLATTWRWDTRAGELRPGSNLPSPRTQCQVVAHGGKVLILGGVDFVPDADGGTTRGDMREVLVLDTATEGAAFTVADFQLPRPRRSFGTAVLSNRLFLVGGLGEDFDHAGPVDRYDFATSTWSHIDAPTAWVSPQVAVIGDRFYVACGGTMDGQRFTEDRSLWSWSEAEGWRCVVTELPFPVRHVQMLALRNRLLFYAANDPRGDRIVVRTLAPDASVIVAAAAFHR